MPRSARTAPATRPSAGILLTALAVVISTLVLPSPVASADPATGSGSGGSAAASDERDEGSESGSGSGSDSASGSGSDPTDAPAVAAPRITVIGPGDVPEGATARFTAEVRNAAPGGVGWMSAPAGSDTWTTIGDGPVLTLVATPALDGRRYRASVTGPGGTATSGVTTLRVTPAPATPTAGATPTPTAATPTQTARATPTPTAATPTPTARATPTPTAATPTPARQPFGTVERRSIIAGDDQTAVGHNFAPGTPVQVTLEPGGIDLGTFPATADGTVTTHFGTAGLPPGDYRVVWTTP